VIVRYGKTSFELSTPVRDLGWIVDGAQGFDVSVTNATATRAVIGVKGPMAGALLAVAGFAGGPSVQASETPVQPAWRQAQVSLVRDAAGDGFELWTQADDGIVVWDRLWRSGTGLGVTAVGARVLEACRVEKGIPLVMSDWNPIQITLDAADCRLPGDLGFEPTLARRFNGVEQLRRCGVTSRSHRLVQVCADEPMVKGKLTLKQTVVGTVTSPVWSWSQNRSFAFAWLKLEHCHANVQLQAPGLNGPLSCVVARERIFQTEAGL
jgi:aminomethyltransferase